MAGLLIKNRTAKNRTSRRPSSIPVVGGVPLARWTNGELATRLHRRRDDVKVEPGVGWARAGDRPEKLLARREVLSLFTPRAFPQYLSILTFPGLSWHFERALLGHRERPVDVNFRQLQNTYICALEREETIFRASIPNMPRGLRGHAARITVHPTPHFATASVGTHAVKRYHRCAFEDYAASDATRSERGRVLFDAAWLDFNGQLGPMRLAAIERFWNCQLRSILVVTLLNARMCPTITGLVAQHGGIDRLLEARLSGASLSKTIHYGDCAPMVQITLTRSGATAVAS